MKKLSHFLYIDVSGLVKSFFEFKFIGLETSVGT